MNGVSDFSWMRVVMRTLFDDYTREQALAAISSEPTREQLRATLQSELSTGRLGSIPTGEYGDNLLQALLALRVKFPEAEAFEKLEVNIALRDRRAPNQSR